MSQLCNNMLMSGGLPISLWATWAGTSDGTPAVFRTTLTVGVNVTALSSTLVVATWEDAGVGDTIFACAGTVSGVTITWGTPVELLAINTGSSAIVTAMSATTAVVCWLDNTAGVIGKAVALSVSGTTITIGTPVVIAAATSSEMRITALSATKAVVVYYATVAKGNAVVLDLSTLIITAGTPFQYNSTANSDYPNVRTISSTQALIVYANASNYGTAQVLDISGSTITGNTAYSWNAAISTWLNLAALSSTKFGVLYANNANSNRGTVVVLSVAGTVVTYGTPVQVSTVSAAGTLFYGFCKADNQTLFSIWKLDATHINASTITVSGTTATVNAAVLYKATNTTEFGCAYIDDTHLITCYRDNNNSNRGTGRISRV